MRLQPMQFKDYRWPHNPKTYTIEYRRAMAVHKIPFGRYALQNLGMNRRVIKGEGEFVGEGAYEEFRKLAAVFYLEGAGMLAHPVWQSIRAHFVELTLLQEPKTDYVGYSFTFWEDYDGYATSLKKVTTDTSSTEGKSDSGAAKQQYHTVITGDTLWGISKRYSLNLDQILTLNPQIKNPNRIVAGQQVRIV